MIALASAGMGFLVRELKVWERTVLAAIGLLLIDPTIATDILGVGGLAVMAIFVWLTNRKRTLSPG